MSDRYVRIREALEMGPTPGPWDGDDNSVSRLWSNGSVGIREYIALPDSDPNPANMHWIAACDPDTIRDLLAERDALDKALKLAEFMMTKDSLCKDERLKEGLAVIRRARNTGDNDVND